MSARVRRGAEVDVTAPRALEIGQHILFVVLLVLGVTRALHLDSLGIDGHHGAAAIVGAGLTGAWYVTGIVLSRRARRSGPTARTTTPTISGEPGTATASGTRSRVRGHRGWVGVAWFAGLIAFWLALLALSPDFSWVAFALFLLAIHLLPTGPALAVIAALTTVVVAVQLATGADNPGQVAGPIVGALVAAGGGLLYRRILAESERRRQLVAELVAAQDDLVTVHDELARTQHEAGVLAERARLARDIHDTLAQGFSSILLLSRAARAADDATRAEVLAQIETTAGDNLDEARRVVHALTPASLETAPLSAALSRLLDRLSEQTGIETGLDVDGDIGPLGTTREVALLRIAQSALANVRLHSGASRVVVSMTGGSDGVTLDVVDDGVGFDPALLERAPLGGTGFGLRAMRERLAALGGTLTVTSAPGEGTTLTAVVPDRSTP